MYLYFWNVICPLLIVMENVQLNTIICVALPVHHADHTKEYFDNEHYETCKVKSNNVGVGNS